MRPQGIEIAGMPASDIGTVQKSLRYIASGSAVFSPSRNATVGEVGRRRSGRPRAKAAAKSSAIMVRTLCAWP